MSNLDIYIERASNVPPGGVAIARTIIYDLHKDGLPKSDAYHVASTISDVSGIDRPVLWAMLQEAAHHHPHHGLLMTASDVTKAVIQELSEKTSAFVWCGSAFHVWWNDFSNHTGFLDRMNTAEFKVFVRQIFPDSPVVENHHKLERVVESITHQTTDHHFLDDRRPGLCTVTGWVEFDQNSRALVLKPHGPENKATFGLEATYDPDARATVLESGLSRLLPADRVTALQEFIGCILFGIRLGGDNARNCLMLYGPPNSGKSSVTDIIAAMLPPDAIASLPPEKWSQTEAVSALVGKSLNIVTESGQKAKIKSADFKTVISGERLTGRYRYGNEFSFRPMAKHIMATNTIPKFDIPDESLCRRILAIQFDRSLTRDQIDPDFVEKVKAELPGFINWCAEGAQRAMERGYFALPACHDTVTELIMFGDDLVGAFANRMIEVTGAQTDAVSTVELRTALKRFAEERGVDVSDWTVNTHARQLGTLLQEKYQAHRVQRDGLPHYLRIRLRSPEVSG